MKYISHIASNNTLTLIFQDHAPISIPVENPVYDKVIELIRNGSYDKIFEAATKQLSITTTDRISTVGNDVYIDGKSLPKALSERIKQMLIHQLPVDALIKFWDNVQENPNPGSVYDLYNFLEKNHFPISNDGCFIAYKSVTDDLLDWHTRKIKNTPGTIIEMPRDKVDHNRNNTCSTGLHAAAFKYATEFGDKNSVIIEIKINPKDVVSVPTDYNAQKMRCCRYEVIRVNRKPLREQIYSGKVTRVKHGQRKLKTGIKRLSAAQKTIIADNKGAISITTDIISRIGLNAGDKMFIVITSNRARNFRITKSKPKSAFFIKEMIVGKSSTRIFSNILAMCQINGYNHYTLSFNNNDLVVKA